MEEQHKLVGHSPQAIAITSGKGGVGKTFFSVHLAARAVEQGKRVLIMDADLGLANVDVMLGLTAKGSIQQVVEGVSPLHDILVTNGKGIDVLPGGSGLHELANISAAQQRLLLDEMDVLASEYDLILIDTPAGIGENVLFFVSSSESILTVLTPDPTSLTDVYALIKVLSRQRDVRRFMVAVNQADEIEARITFNRLLAVTDRYLDVNLDYVGYMPACKAVRSAIQSQSLLYSCASEFYTNNLNELLDSILSRPRDVSRGGGLQFFWQRSLNQSLGSQPHIDATG